MHSKFLSDSHYLLFKNTVRHRSSAVVFTLVAVKFWDHHIFCAERTLSATLQKFHTFTSFFLLCSETHSSMLVNGIIAVAKVMMKWFRGKRKYRHTTITYIYFVSFKYKIVIVDNCSKQDIKASMDSYNKTYFTMGMYCSWNIIAATLINTTTQWQINAQLFIGLVVTSPWVKGVINIMEGSLFAWCHEKVALWRFQEYLKIKYLIKVYA